MVILSLLAVVTVIYFALQNPQNQPAVLGTLYVDEKYGWEKITTTSADSELGKLIHNNAVLDYRYGFIEADPDENSLLLAEFDVPGATGYVARLYELGEKFSLIAKVDQVDQRLNVLPATLMASGTCTNKECKDAIVDFTRNLVQK